ncbi:MAG: hypothetical protein IKF38_06455 [Clostridia bacterium]|nr:hypothetical protein [Clostridia bacterium]
MDNLNSNTKDKFERVTKVYPWKRYNDSLDSYFDILYTLWGGSVREYLPKRTEEEKYTSSLDVDNLKIRAIEMYEGEAEFDKEWFLRLFEKLLNYEIFEILLHEDSRNLCNDKNFILELMEHSGAVLEIASFADKDAIMQIFEDKELLEKIYKKEILTGSNLDGSEIISVLLLQLNYLDEITQDKNCMSTILKNIEEVESSNKKSDIILAVMCNVLARNFEDLLKDREFTEAVFDFIEDTYGELSVYDINSFIFDELAKKMLSTPELASDEELAKRYVKNLKWLHNVDRNLFGNKDFMEMALDNGDPVAFDNFELPLKFYFDPNILEKYLKAKKEFGINGINFDFDNEVFAKLYEQYYNESIETCMRDEIARAIEQNNSIIISGYDDSIDYDEIISVLQQWAEDEDLIKIDDKIKVVNNPEGEIVEGQINIVIGGNSKNTISTDSDYNTTIVLDGHKIASILKKIGIDTRIDMKQMQELYSEMIGKLKQKSQERKIMPQEVSEIIKGSNLLNHGQNYINIIVDEESDKIKAVLSIPHPVYRNDFQKVEFDGEELLEIIELANNNSPEELSSDIIQMLPELGQRREKNQELVELVQELARQKSNLEEKEQGAKELLEQYEELNGEKNKSVSDD